MGCAFGFALLVFLGLGLSMFSKLFTNDPQVLEFLVLGIPVSFLTCDDVMELHHRPTSLLSLYIIMKEKSLKTLSMCQTMIETILKFKYKSILFL